MREPFLTDRLLLRDITEADADWLFDLDSDPEVMRYFPSTLTREQSDAMVAHLEAAFERNGYGLWAVEVRGGPSFIGFVGLNPVSFDAAFTPAVEIGWRLARAQWRRGYATEAAQRALDVAFGDARLDEVVSFTTTANEPSRAVMVRLGMVHDPAEDFDHPRVPEGPLRRHVLYRLTAAARPPR